MQKHFAVLIALALAAAPFSARGAECNTNINGTYSVTCQGFVFISSTAFVPIAVVGVQSRSSDGSFSGPSNVSMAGQWFEQYATGTPTYNDDCISGTILYNVTGGASPTQTFAFVVLDHGDRIRSIATDTGSTYSCLLERISKVPAPAQ